MQKKPPKHVLNYFGKYNGREARYALYISKPPPDNEHLSQVEDGLKDISTSYI